MIGQTVGNYTITGKLARGGMGEVYLAEHPRIGRKVAIKMLYPHLSVDRRQVERLFDEALATNLVKHPAIVQIFDCGFHLDRAYLVMEHLEGESLGVALRLQGSFSVAAACEHAARITDALAAAHDHQIVHRDLKPDNLFLSTSGTGPPSLKILDFGVAKLTARPAGAHTDNTVLLGTPAYMSPEQCRGAHAVDARTDIYALGCILFEMVTGRAPFVYPGWGEYIAAHQNEAPPTPAELRPGLPPALNALILSMLAKRPEDRPQTMREVAARLAEVPLPAATEVLPSPATVSDSQSVQLSLLGSARSPAPVPRRRPVLPLAAAAVLLVGGAAWWSFHRPEALPRNRSIAPSVADPPPEEPAAAAPAVDPVTTVEVRGAPSGTRAWVDGQPATLPLRLPRGQAHELLFRAPGYDDLHRTWGPDEAGPLHLSFKATPRPRRKPARHDPPPARVPQRFRGFDDL
jgi:serine/threonine protein kinase